MNCPGCGVSLVGGMKVCPRCKFDTSKPDGGELFKKYQEEKEIENRKIEEKKRESEELLKRNMELAATFMETTGYTFEGYRITAYKGIVSGEIVLGTGFLSELSAGLSDIMGNSSSAMGGKISTAKQAALRDLKINCIKRGANAVIGVDLDFMTIGANMIVACASGTAVLVEKE